MTDGTASYSAFFGKGNTTSGVCGFAYTNGCCHGFTNGGTASNTYAGFGTEDAFGFDGLAGLFGTANPSDGSGNGTFGLAAGMAEGDNADGANLAGAAGRTITKFGQAFGTDGGNGGKLGLSASRLRRV